MHYYGYEESDIWALPFTKTIQLYNKIPSMRYFDHAPTLYLGWMFSQFLGNKTEYYKFVKMLGVIPPDDGAEDKKSGFKNGHYSKQVVQDVELAFKNGHMTNQDLKYLDATLLRASGAWKN